MRVARQQLRLLLGHRRAQRRHHVLDAVRRQRDVVHVALHHQRALRLADGAAAPAQPVEHAPLVVDRASRASSGTWARAPPPRPITRPPNATTRPPSSAIGKISRPRKASYGSRRTCVGSFTSPSSSSSSFAIPWLPRRVAQRRPALRRPAQAEALRRLAPDPPPLQVPARLRPAPRPPTAAAGTTRPRRRSPRGAARADPPPAAPRAGSGISTPTRSATYRTASRKLIPRCFSGR